MEVSMVLGSYLLCFLTSAVLSLVLTRWVRELAIEHGCVETPKLNRHVHTRPVPRLGGVAIYTCRL